MERAVDYAALSTTNSFIAVKRALDHAPPSDLDLAVRKVFSLSPATPLCDTAIAGRERSAFAGLLSSGGRI